MKKADISLIENLLLCDPVTERGRNKLYDLGLQDEITPEVFFHGNNCLWAPPADLLLVPSDDEELEYDSTPDERRIEQIVTRRLEFDSRFKATNQDSLTKREFTLLMGVVGGGKSIELQRQIYENYSAIPYSYSYSQFQSKYERIMSPNVILIDLERINTVIALGAGYQCPKEQDALWLFFTKLLATLINYVKFLYENKEYREKLKNVRKNLLDNFDNREKQTSSVRKYSTLLEVLDSYANSENGIGVDLADLFDAVVKTIRNEVDNRKDPITGEQERPVIASIRAVLHLMGYIMFGVSPNDKKLIAIDNVEDFIKVNDAEEISISLENAKEIFRALQAYAGAIKDIYNQASITGSFHVVMALRRTTWGNLQAKFAGNYRESYGDMFDLTGDIALTDLWNHKAYPIWKNFLQDRYDRNAAKYIDEVNYLLNDNISRNGIPQRFSRIMSHGLRRQGHSLSKVMFNMFFNKRFGFIMRNDKMGDEKYINIKKFDELFESEYSQEAKYLLRSSAVELYFMNQYVCTGVDVDENVGKRWRQLDIGRLEIKQKQDNQKLKLKYYGFDGIRRTNGPTVDFTKWVYKFGDSTKNEVPSNSLVRGILTALDEAPEAERASKCVAPLYEAISLFDMMKKTLGKPLGSEIDEEQELLPLSEVLLAGARPDTEAEYSPLFILQDGVDFSDTYSFSERLKTIWKAGPAKSADGKHPYCRQLHGIRITEAGADFLHNIQPSFEYFSALFCNDFPPLLFIKSTDEIAHVIGCIYNYADKVCNPRRIDQNLEEIVVFRDQVLTLHKQYLRHYRDYIENMGEIIGFTPGGKKMIIDGVNSVMKKYESWMEKI